MSQLPVDPLIPQIVKSLSQHPCLVLEAPPGAGKTTRVPPALLASTDKQILVLEPRRLAARLAARRVAAELRESVGKTVGFQVRFEKVASAQTRVHFLTEGVLTRRFASDANLRDSGIVILDEFHERHIDTDLAFALLHRLQQTTRPDLKIIVMSATLDTSPISAFLDNCPVLRSEGRLYEMSIRYRPHSSEPVEEQVRGAVELLLQEDAPGDILAFLPGTAEILRCQRALENTARRFNLLLTPLYGDLSPEEQDRAVQPAAQRKVILSTNVAESSVTIEGVRNVIDSGLARIASHSPWSGLPVLQVSRISQASATQRAGRAARTAPGRVIRLYPEEDLLRRAARETPAIEREDLAELALTLHAVGVRSFSELQWLEPPPQPAVIAAEQLLTRLGALGEDGRLTPIGREMTDLPIAPRLARLVIEAQKRDASDDGVQAAALLSLGARLPPTMRHATLSDVFALMEGEAPYQTKRLASSIRQSIRTRPQRKQNEDGLRMAILAAFPDRVARRRNKDELLLVGGGSALLAQNSTVRDAPLMVAIDIEDRIERGMPLVRLASAFEPEWLIDLFPDRVTDRVGVEWNRSANRVEAVSALLYDNLMIEESRGGRIDPVLASALLAEKAKQQGLVRFTDMDELNAFLSRVEFASQHSSIPPLTEADALSALGELSERKQSFNELEAETRDGGLVRYLESKLNKRLLDEVAPERWKLPSGRTGRIEYAAGQAPRLSAKLQEFFGMKETPRIAKGKVPLVVLLLAPNQRPVQTTTDLAGFWERLYPQVRKELMRRYPRHPWPENPQ